MFARVQDFVSSHANDFAPTSLGKELSNTLATIVTELDGHASSEASGFGSERQGTSTRSLARAALREDLEAISRTARAMAGDVPGIDEKFRVPPPGNDQRLLSAARAFATDAAPFSAQFIAHELPADFLADLNADIAALEAAISAQSSGAGNHVAASAAIDDAIDRGVEIVRRLDAIVKNKYANSSSILAEWTSASHTERAPRGSAAAAGQTVPPSGGTGGSPPPA